MNEYVILTDATADHAETFMNQYPGFEIIPMEVTVNRKQYIYGGPQSEITCNTFYCTSAKESSVRKRSIDKCITLLVE